jgi:cytochrome c-type biogenesis protein CcmE
VVVNGALGADGTFHADQLLAKCPSKYEAAADAGEEMPHLEKATGEI